MSWRGTTYERPEDQASIQSAALWIWQLEMRAYPLLEETFGYEFGGIR